MKKFVAKLSVFLVIFGAALALMEIGFRAKPTTFKSKYEGLEQNASRVELLMLGHSHANEGFDSRVTKHRSYNMAVGFQNVYFDDFILGQFVDRMDSLKCVAIATSYYHFFNEIPELDEMRGENLFNMVKYHLYWGLDSLKNSRIPNSPKYNLEILNNPATAYFTMFGYYLSGAMWRDGQKNELSRFLDYGFDGGHDTSHSEDFLDDNGLFYANAHNPAGVLIPEHPYNYEKYRHIAETCKKKGVTYAIVLFPCWHTYVNNLNSAQLEATRNMMTSIADQFDNCVVLDHMSDDRFNSNDFQDAIHLNCHGAAKFAEILEAELDSLKTFE